MAGLRIARSRARPAEYAEPLKEAVGRLRAAQEHLDEVEEIYRQNQAEVLTIMSQHGIKTSVVVMEDAKFRVTSVQGERLDIDETGLRKALTAPIFDKLCDLKLNRTKLEVAIAEGRVDPVVVATHTSKHLNKPYPKLTVLAGSEQ